MGLMVAPSVLAVWDKSGGDYQAVADAARLATAAGAEWIHVDIMDGQFVPARTFSVEMIEALRGVGVLDVHLMVVDADLMVEDCVRAGAGQVVFHPTGCNDVGGALRRIRRLGAVAGLALDVDEGVELLEPWAEEVDQVLVMTVKAGAGGQSFRPDMLDKVRQVRAMVGPDVCVVVDGGVKAEVVQACRMAGVDCVVAGSSVFSRLGMEEAELRAAMADLRVDVGPGLA